MNNLRIALLSTPDCRKLRNRSIYWRFPSKPKKKLEALVALETSPSFRQTTNSKITVGLALWYFLCYP